ncbi:MAG TPA: diguanylate cyclase [Candidatus Mcinerneyibacteriales bacterium]|nr:diguanylate cyclase [Candidatus Mcinerneyibacteriales bacterium]
MSETVAIFTEKKELYAIPLIVSKHGYRTHIVNTLKDLKGAAQRGKAQAVILDLDAGLDEHLELLERIVREKDPAISVIVIARETSLKALRRAMQLGIRFFLTRPFPERELIEALEKSFFQYHLERENETLLEKLNRKVYQLNLLNETAKMLNSSLKLDDILLKLMQNAGALVNAEAWTLFMYNKEKNVLVFKYVVGEASDKLTGVELPWGTGIVGWAAANRQSILVKDTGKDERFFKKIDKKTKFTTKSVICVPIVYRDDLLGVVEVINKQDGSAFDEEDLNILEILVEDAAISIKNTYLLEETYTLTLMDHLTRLYNLRKLNDLLGEFQEEKHPFSLLFMDLDNFKSVNDNYGHAYGSSTLIEFAELLKKIIDTEEYGFRYGGDEFILLLPGKGIEEARECAEKIHECLRTYKFINKDGIAVTLSVSIGISHFPSLSPSGQEALFQADRAMYSVKRRGKNGTALFHKNL